MSDLVERLRQMAGDTHRGWGPAYIENAGRDMAAAADAIEAAQARIEAVRRETIAECAAVADARWDAIVVPEAQGGCDTAAAIRALTEAKEDHIPDARKMVEAKEDRT